jgi:hypothetical protein
LWCDGNGRWMVLFDHRRLLSSKKKDGCREWWMIVIVVWYFPYSAQCGVLKLRSSIYVFDRRRGNAVLRAIYVWEGSVVHFFFSPYKARKEKYCELFLPLGLPKKVKLLGDVLWIEHLQANVLHHSSLYTCGGSSSIGRHSRGTTTTPVSQVKLRQKALFGIWSGHLLMAVILPLCQSDAFLGHDDHPGSI